MDFLPCANCKQENGKVPCPEKGTKACSRCQLVAYCSRECQVEHWPFHKLDCNSDIRKPTWKPAWELERRIPDFVENSNHSVSTDFATYGGNKYLWGNVPALDLLQLKNNEGSNTKRDLSLLLAASGDPRNLVKTIACLPEGYNGHIHIDVNDRDETVVSRNLLIFLVAFHLPPEKASLIMLHLWYSAFLPEDLVESIQSKIAPLVQKVVKSKAAREYDNMEASWECSSATLSVQLPGKTWSRLASYFPGKTSVPFEKACAQRQSVTLAHSRRDYRDRATARLPPSWRLAKLRFRREGVLLPFGASSERFNVPNPTLFQHQFAWPMPDSADPLDGWKSTEFMTETHGAKEDIYGQLHFHVRNTLFKFCQKIATLDLDICLFQMDAEGLPERLSFRDNVQTYDRIELSNIADRAYLGPLKTLALFSAFLKDRLDNPNSTLLMLFLNVTHEETTPAHMIAGMETSMRKVIQHLPINPQLMFSRDGTSAEVVKLMQAQTLFADNDALFDRFLKATQLEEIAELFFGVAIKEKNTIVAKWPMRLGKKPTQNEFDMVFRSGHVGSERYVEWRRTR